MTRTEKLMEKDNKTHEKKTISRKVKPVVKAIMSAKLA